MMIWLSGFLFQTAAAFLFLIFILVQYNFFFLLLLVMEQPGKSVQN